MTLPLLAEGLAFFFKTGCRGYDDLAGVYDIRLEFLLDDDQVSTMLPEALQMLREGDQANKTFTPDTPRPPVFAALQKQLGLKPAPRARRQNAKDGQWEECPSKGVIGRNHHSGGQQKARIAVIAQKGFSHSPGNGPPLGHVTRFDIVPSSSL